MPEPIRLGLLLIATLLLALRQPAPEGIAAEPFGPPLPAGPGCFERLTRPAGTRATRASAPKPEPGCGVADPVLLYRVGGAEDAGAIALKAPPLLDCPFALRLSEWLTTSARPLARGHFGAEIVALQVGGGYECRRRNRQAATPVSEHAAGRALDIVAFEIAAGGSRPPRLIKLAGPNDDAASRFLRAIRDSACGAFMTTLGPGADAAHADHLHVDIQERRSPASKFCQ